MRIIRAGSIEEVLTKENFNNQIPNVLRLRGGGSSTSNPNYIQLTNGLIIQWGVTSTKTGVREIVETVTFPTNFTNTNYTMVCSPNMWISSTTVRQAGIGVYTKNVNNCKISFYGLSTSDTGYSLNWIAIGY